MRRRILTILSTGTIAGALMFGVTLTGTSDHHSSAVAETVPVAIEQQETITETVEQETTETALVEQEQEQEQETPLMVQEEQVGAVSEELPNDAPAPCHWVGLTVEECDKFANPAPGTVSVIIVYGTTFSQVEEILIWQDGKLLDISYAHTDHRPEW